MSIKAKWDSDDGRLHFGEEVEILCSDPEDPNVPGRRACWVRSWQDGRDYPVYRSCDLSDLILNDEDYDRLPVPHDLEADLLRTATAFIEELKAFGYGETSEKALPGAFDPFQDAVERMKG